MLQLLNEVQLRYEQLTDRVTRNKAVWNAVSAALQKYIPGVTGGQCDQKWRNLKQHWKKYVDNQKKTGRGKMARPEFFDEIGEILGSSHAIQPLHVFESLSEIVGPASDVSFSSTASSQWSRAAQSTASHAAGGPSSRVMSSVAYSAADPSTPAGVDVRLTQSATDLASGSGAATRKRIRPVATKERLEAEIHKLIDLQTVSQDKHFMISRWKK